MISALSWIPKGKAKVIPDRVDLTAEEVADIAKDELPQEGDSDEALAAKLRMDDYDNEPDAPIFVEDDAITQQIEEEGDEASDIDDLNIRPTDALVLSTVANDQDDFSRLIVYVYEEAQHNLYVHHDIMLASFPLCLSWMDFHPSSEGSIGNCAAVGTFEPTIEIWNLDVIDVMEPLVSLGAADEEGNTTKDAHKDAVMGLSWNQHHRVVLASGSADSTVKLWDMSTKACIQTLNPHKDKVQSVAWNPKEASVLLTGSFDKTVTVSDIRSKDSIISWKICGDCEGLQWNPHNPRQFIVASETGNVHCFDALAGAKSKPVWTLKAHDSAASALAINSSAPLMMTGANKSAKFWSIAGAKPEFIQERAIEDNVMSASFYGDSPYLMILGGQNHNTRVWDLRASRWEPIQKKFGSGGGTVTSTTSEADEEAIVDVGVAPPDDMKEEWEAAQKAGAEDQMMLDEDAALALRGKPKKKKSTSIAKKKLTKKR